MDKKKQEEERQKEALKVKEAQEIKMKHLEQAKPQQSLDEILNTRINTTNISNRNNLE